MARSTQHWLAQTSADPWQRVLYNSWELLHLFPNRNKLFAKAPTLITKLPRPALSRYLRTLYGDGRAPRSRELHMLWADLLNLSVDSPQFNVACASLEPGVLHDNRCGWQREWDPPTALFVARPREEVLIGANDSTIEVTHCSERRKVVAKGGQHTAPWCRRRGCFESETSWMYATPGSGMFYRLGRTAAFPTPEAFVASVLDARCRRPSCIEHLEAAFGRLRDRGFQSVQFFGYQDQRCNMTSTNVVDLHRPGLEDDPCRNHRFLTASGRACRCVSHGGCARCLPRGARAVNRTKPCVPCPVTEEIVLS